MSKVIRLDDFYEAVSGETTIMEVRGERFELPLDLPMLVLLAFMDPDVGQGAATLELMASVYGADKVNLWLQGDENGEGKMPIREFGALVDQTVFYYFPAMAKAGDGDPKAAETT